MGPGKSLALLRRDGLLVFVLRFGAAVLLVTGDGQGVNSVLAELEPMVDDPDDRVHDTYELVFNPDAEDRVEFGRVVLSSATPEKLSVVALLLAQSTSLEHYELLADGLTDEAAHVTDALAAGRAPRARTRQMLRFIAQGLVTRRELVTHLSILDPPESTWEDLQVERLYESLRSNFDLQSRFRTLEYKLELVKETAQLMVDLFESRRFTILELVIILLIAVEILLYLPSIWK